MSNTTGITARLTPAVMQQIATALRTGPSGLTAEQQTAVRLITQNYEREQMTDYRHLVYMLATCYHESRFRPIREIKAKEDSAVWLMQQKYWSTGYYGRGYVQLTWRKNYEVWARITGADLVNNPDLALQPDIAAFILVRGMRTGLFTGRTLDRYINQTGCDYLNARKVVNGTFHADIIKRHADRLDPVIKSIALQGV